MKKKWGAGNIKKRKKGGKPGCACAHPRVNDRRFHRIFLSRHFIFIICIL
jgi:hypothetical protein